MKVCTYLDGGRERLGFIVGNDDVLEAPAELRDMPAFIRSGTEGRRAAEAYLARAPASARKPLSSVKLAPPIRPPTMLCSGSNYRDHNKEKANTPISGKEPEFFVKTADCIIGPGDRIIYDEKLTKKLDAETELAIVIGKPGRHIPVERALEHVFGYTIVNDVTARDRQVRRNEQGFTWYELGRSKCFETSGPTGPWIVTADEIGDPQKLRLRTRINGELR
ncbi:MAG TPA: fumarylacetoacetate hydrolase family protein, partial [Burkholderiales bacterium]|nr:fumarylacetoacetate hydrolase family protein [Burkholderiales bacterium]